MKHQHLLMLKALTPIFIVAILGALLMYRYLSAPHEPIIRPSLATETSPPSLSQNSATIPDESQENTLNTASGARQSADSQTPIDTSDRFSDRLPALFTQRREKSRTFITRDDLPVRLQQKLDIVLANYKRNGYLDTDESYIEYMNVLENEITEVDFNDPMLMVKPENVDNTLLAEMDYVGAIPDRIPGTHDTPIPGIRRIYKSEAGSLSFYEADLTHSEALLQKEFVNTSVKGYPATQITSCAPSGRCITQLSWLTGDKRFELTLNGDIKAFGADKLTAIASSLELPPIPEE